MKHLFFLLFITFSINAQSENKFNCNAYLNYNQNSKQITDLRTSYFKARAIVRYKQHRKLNEDKFIEFLKKSTQKNDTLNTQLFSCLVVQDLGYDYQARVINIQHKINAQKQKRRMEHFNKLPINNTSIVFLGSLSTGINAFVFQDFVKKSTTNRKLDTDKLLKFIESYKSQNI